MKTMVAQIKDPPPVEGAVEHGLPESLVAPLERALAKDPEERFPSAGEFMAAVEEARSAAPSERSNRSETAVPVTEVGEDDRRRDRRLDIVVNCWIRVVGDNNTIIQQEQTIGENISTGGVCVRTSITHLAKGERVMFEEVGGPFRTRAEVRGYTMGADRISRLHLKFVDPLHRSTSPAAASGADDGGHRGAETRRTARGVHPPPKRKQAVTQNDGSFARVTVTRRGHALLGREPGALRAEDSRRMPEQSSFLAPSDRDASRSPTDDEKKAGRRIDRLPAVVVELDLLQNLTLAEMPKLRGAFVR